MKKVIITLTVVPSKLLLGLVLNFSVPNDFYEVDPVALKQPAKRIFLSKDKNQSGLTISLHKEVFQSSFQEFMKNTQIFVQSNFPFDFLFLGEFENNHKIKVYLYHLKPQKKDLTLEILQAYFVEKNTAFLLSYSAPKNLFYEKISEFQKTIQTAKIEELPGFCKNLKFDDKLKITQNLKDLITKSNINFENFVNHSEINKILHSFEPNLITQENLLELRCYLYD